MMGLISSVTINDELEFIRINSLEILNSCLVGQLHLPWLDSILNHLFKGSFSPFLQNK